MVTCIALELGIGLIAWLLQAWMHTEAAPWPVRWLLGGASVGGFAIGRAFAESSAMPLLLAAFTAPVAATAATSPKLREPW